MQRLQDTNQPLSLEEAVANIATRRNFNANNI